MNNSMLEQKLPIFRKITFENLLVKEMIVNNGQLKDKYLRFL